MDRAPKAHPAQLDSRSHAAPAPRRNPWLGHPRLVRTRTIQPEAARSDPENQRLFRPRMGQPRRRARLRHAAEGMGRGRRERPCGFPASSARPPAIPQRPPRRASIHRSRHRRNPRDAGQSAPLPVLFHRRRQIPARRRPCHHLPLRQKADPRHARRHHRARRRAIPAAHLRWVISPGSLPASSNRATHACTFQSMSFIAFFKSPIRFQPERSRMTPSIFQQSNKDIETRSYQRRAGPLRINIF